MIRIRVSHGAWKCDPSDGARVDIFESSDRTFKELFKEAGLSLYLERTQEGFPEGLFEVKMWVNTTDDTSLFQLITRFRWVLKSTQRLPTQR